MNDTLRSLDDQFYEKKRALPQLYIIKVESNFKNMNTHTILVIFYTVLNNIFFLYKCLATLVTGITK